MLSDDVHCTNSQHVVIQCTYMYRYLPHFVLVPTHYCTGTCLIVCRYLPHIIQVPASLYTGTCLIVCRYLPHCVLVPTHYCTGTCLILYRYLPHCVLVPASYYTVISHIVQVPASCKGTHLNLDWYLLISHMCVCHVSGKSS